MEKSGRYAAAGMFEIPHKMYFLAIHHLLNRFSEELFNVIVFHGLRLFLKTTQHGLVDVSVSVAPESLSAGKLHSQEGVGDLIS